MRPAATFGQFGRTVIESVFVQDVIVGGSVAVVRAGSSFARGLQTGYLRSYAVLLVDRPGRPRPLLPDHGELRRG